MHDGYRLLCARIKDIADLDEGRRDLSGILARAAVVTQEILGVSLVYAAAAVDGASLVSIAEESSLMVRTEPWEGPGRFGRRVLDGAGPLAWRRGEDDAPSAHDFLDLMGLGAWMGVPIPMRDRPAGLLVALREDDRPFSEEEQNLVNLVAEHTAGAIANLRAFQEVESLAITDELTRVYNYRFLKTALRREVARASRYGQTFSVIMIDVDHLKRYNEEHGHLGGSELLRQLAGILARNSRAIDLVAKYGGDEFLIILPQTRLDGAASMGHRICTAVADAAFPHCVPGTITVSIGVASFPQHGATMEALLAAADAALFVAKRQGRNCVVSAESPGNPGRISEAA